MKLKGITLFVTILFFSITIHCQEKQQYSYLYDLSLEELGNIEVSTPTKQDESSINSPAVITVITADEIDLFGASTLYEVLDWIVSTYATGTYSLPQNTISLRGDLSDHYDNHILKLINGRPIRNSNNEGLNTALYLSIPVSSIKQIEVISGAGSVLYGTSAFTGIINIITKESDEADTFEITADGGSFNTRNAEFTGNFNEKGMKIGIAGKFHVEDGWLLEMKDEKGVSGSMRMSEDNIGGVLTAGYKGFTLSSFYLRSNQRAFVQKPDWSAPEEFVNVEKSFVDLGYERNFIPIWNFRVNSTYNRTYAIRGSGIGESDDIIVEMLNKFNWDRAVLRVGGDMNYLNGMADVIPSYSRTWGRMYADADIKLLSYFKITGGSQINLIDSKQLYFLPRAGLVCNINDKIGFKTLYSEGFRSPTALENDIMLPVLTGNPSLHPETVSSFDLQFLYNSKTLIADVCWYYNRQSNLIQRVPMINSKTFTFENTGQGEFAGVEVNAKLNFTKWLLLMGNATYQVNENENGVKNFTTVPNYMAKIGAAVQNEYVSLAVHSSFVGAATSVSVKNPSVKAINPETEEYIYMSANLNVHLSRVLNLSNVKELKLKIHAINLLDEKIMHPEFVRSIINTMPARSGRAFYAQISLGF